MPAVAGYAGNGYYKSGGKYYKWQNRKGSRQLTPVIRAPSRSGGSSRVDAVNRLYQKRYDLLKNLGQTERTRINDWTRAQEGAATGNAIDRGLYGSTVLDSVRQGIQGSASRQLTEMNERMAQRKSDLMREQQQFLTHGIQDKYDHGMAIDAAQKKAYARAYKRSARNRKASQNWQATSTPTKSAPPSQPAVNPLPTTPKNFGYMRPKQDWRYTH